MSSSHGYLPKTNALNTLAVKSLLVSGKVMSPGSLESITLVSQDSVDAGLFERSPLRSDHVYLIHGAVDVTGHTIEVPPGGVELNGVGLSVACLITTDDGSQLFTSPAEGSGNVFLHSLTISVRGAGSSVFALKDADGTHTIEYERTNFSDCSSLGYIDGYRQGLETVTARFGGTPGLEFRGTWGGGYYMQTSLVRGVADSAFSLFKCAPGQSFASRFGGNPNIHLPSSVTAFETTEANFTGDELLQINGASFSGDGTVFAGIDETSTVAYVKNTTGVTNTFVGAFWTISATEATKMRFADQFYKLEGATKPCSLVWFAMPGDNEPTLITTHTVEVVVSFNGSFAGRNNRVCTAKLRHWVDADEEYKDAGAISFTTNGVRRFDSVSLFSPRITMNKNDRVEVWVASSDNRGSITAGETTHLRITEA